MLGPYAQNKLTDAILHCLWGAGLAGFQNPADPPWELQVTSLLQKAEQTRGVLFHVNKILKYKVEIPSIAGQSEGKDLTWCLLTGAAPAKENGTPPPVRHPAGAAQLPARKRGLSPCVESAPTPGCLEMRLPCVTLTDSKQECWDPKALGTAGPQHPVSAKAHVHGGHARQGPLCPGDNAPSSTQHAPILLGQTPA